MDLNGLISTIVTATAALVAIIGGFLVSRVITLSSEQNSIKRKIREFENEIQLIDELIDFKYRNLKESKNLGSTFVLPSQIKAKEEELIDLKEKKDLLVNNRDGQYKIIKEYASPGSIIYFGLGVLAVISAVSIIYPTFYLPYSFERDNPTSEDITIKNYLLGGFIFSLSILFIYLVISTIALSRLEKPKK